MSLMPRQVGGNAPRMPAGASPEPLAALPSVPMWEHDGFGRGSAGMATPFDGFPASAFYAASLQVVTSIRKFYTFSFYQIKSIFEIDQENLFFLKAFPQNCLGVCATKYPPRDDSADGRCRNQTFGWSMFDAEMQDPAC